MSEHIFRFSAKLWQWSGKSSWFFVSLPEELSDQISQNYDYLKAGWGSISVQITCQNINWQTSIFPDKKTKTYLLPIKTVVRQKLGVKEGDNLDVELKMKYALV